MRVLLIFAGVSLLKKFNCVLWLFGAILLYAAYKMFTESDQSPQEDGSYLDSKLIQFLRLFLPYDDAYRGTEFLYRNARGELSATPMLAALLVIEASDLIFAIDSIPCVLGVTDDLFIAYSSNLLAILGLRSLYILMANMLARLSLLRYGLAAMMGFVGFKMLVSEWIHISAGFSLLVILGVVVLTIVITVVFDRQKSSTKETALMVHSSANLNTRAVAVLRLFDWKGGHC